MDKYKLDIFTREHSTELQHLSLNSEDSSYLLRHVVEVLGVKKQANSTVSFFQSVGDNLPEEHQYKEELTNGDLRTIIEKKGVKLDSLVYVIWDLEASVDLFIVSELLKNWEYIWYDVSDEAVVLFFPYSESAVLATQHGYLRCR